MKEGSDFGGEVLAGEAVVGQPPKNRPAGFQALMRNRNYSLLWSGQLISEVGNRFHWVAVSLWVYSVTHSASAVSLAIASTFAGSLLVSLWAGPIVDRLNRRGILIVTDIARAILVFAIPFLMQVNLWLVYVDLVLISVATAFFRPAILAIMQQIVPRTQLMQANSFFTAMDTATEIGAPVLAGFIAQSLGRYSPLLYADAVTYLASALCVAGMAVRTPRSDDTGPLNLSAIWAGAMGGLRYLRGDRLQWALFVLIFPAAIVGGALNGLQTPLAKGEVGVSDFQFGVFQGVWGAGFLVASLILGWFGAQQRRSIIMLGGFFLGFASAALMGLARSVEVLLFTGFMVGFSNTFYYVATSTILMEQTPEGMLGRILSTRQLAISAVRVFSPVAAGAIAEAFGIRIAVLGLALVSTLGTGLVMIANPTILRFDAAHGAPRWIGRSWEVAAGPVHPDFDPEQQRRLSLILLAIVAITSIFLFAKVPIVAFLSVLAVTVLWLAGHAIRLLGWKT